MPAIRQYNGGVPFPALQPTDAFVVNRIGVGTGFVEADVFAPFEESFAGPVIRSTRSWTTWIDAAISWAQDLSPMVGYAAYGGTTGGNGYPVQVVTNASNDPSVLGSVYYCADQGETNGGAIIVFEPFGSYVVTEEQVLSLGPNTTLAAPGYNVTLTTNDGTLNMIVPTGANLVLKGIKVLRSVVSNGGDDFTYGTPPFSPAGTSPVALGIGDGVTTTFALTVAVPPISPHRLTVIDNGVIVATDLTTGTYNGAGITGTINFATGALSTTFTTPPVAAEAVQARFVTTYSLGTGNGSTTTFSGTINTAVVPSTISVTVAGVGVAGDNGSGAIGAPGIAGTINYGTGAISVTFTTAPAAGAAISVTYTVLQQYGTGDGSTTTFTHTLTGPFLNGVVAIYLANVAQTNVLSPATGTIAGTGITGTVNYLTGAVSVTWGAAPAVGAVLQIGYVSSGQGAGDELHLNPPVTTKVWVYQCTFQFAGDGLIDIASSALVPSSSACYVTVQNCWFRWHDKGCALGSDSGFIPLGTPPVLFVTWTGNVHVGVASRNPRVGPLTFVHSYNNMRILAPHIRPDGKHGDIAGFEIGNASGYGLSEGDLFIAAYDTVAYPGGVAAAYNFFPASAGALKINGAVVIGDLPLIPGNQGFVPTPPYAYTVNAVPAPNTSEMGAYIDTMFANAGADRADNGVNYTTVPWADALAGGPSYVVDGYSNDVQFDSNGNLIGVYRSTGDPLQAENPQNSTDIELAAQTVTLSGGVATLSVADNLYRFAPNSGTSDTVKNIVTDGSWQFSNGQIIKAQPSSAANTITFSAAGAGSPGCILTPNFSFIMTGANGWVELQYGADLNSGLGAFQPVIIPLQPSGSRWVPTFTAVSNCGTPTLVRALYIISGSVVTCWGLVSVTPTAGGNAATTFTAPLPSLSIPANSALSGQMVCDTGAAMLAGEVFGSGGVALFKFYSPGTSAYTFSFSFSYSSL